MPPWRGDGVIPISVPLSGRERIYGSSHAGQQCGNAGPDLLDIAGGAARFSAIGTEHSKGTKVFALAGKVARGGLIEVPMGTTIRQVIFEIGGGIANGRQF